MMSHKACLVHKDKIMDMRQKLVSKYNIRQKMKEYKTEYYGKRQKEIYVKVSDRIDSNQTGSYNKDM